MIWLAQVTATQAPIIQVQVPTWLSLSVIVAVIGVGITWGALTTQVKALQSKSAKIEAEMGLTATRSDMDGLAQRLTDHISLVHTDVREIRAQQKLRET